jgi:protein O-mannosyl-transferase
MQRAADHLAVVNAPTTTAAARLERRAWLPAAILAVTGVLVYANSFQGQFIFDDHNSIENASVHQLWPPWPALFAPENVHRPLVSLSLAINYAISGYQVWSYHLVNLLIHLAAAAALFGIVRRTLLGERLRARFAERADVLALAVALVWMVHPLQTQAVTYIIQRGESLMGMFYLVTLYCAIRSFDSPTRRLWSIAAITACAAGMLSKQVMLTAPLSVWLYDYLFISGSLLGGWRRRWRLYAGLAATWGVLAATLLAAPTNLTAGFAVKEITPWRYFISEFSVIVHYLRLSVWPSPLVLDYAWPVAQTAGEVMPYALLVGALAAASLWGLFRRQPLAYAGVWFFLILSLTSTFMPFSDLVFEHRMYLPLAGVVTLVVVGGYALGQLLMARLTGPTAARLPSPRLIGGGALAIVLVMLGSLTFQRNTYYQNEIFMWMDVLKHQPADTRAHNNLGILLLERGATDDAIAHFSEACRLKPDYALAKNNLGRALVDQGRNAEALPLYAELLESKPNYAEAHFHFGRALLAQSDFKAAQAHFKQAIKLDPNYAEAYLGLAIAAKEEGTAAAAIEPLRRAVELRPEWVEALDELALIMATHPNAEVRDAEQSVQLAERAVRLTRAERALPLDVLAAAYAEARRFAEAVETTRQAAQLARASGDTQLADEISAWLVDYQAQRPRREPPLAANQQTARR